VQVQVFNQQPQMLALETVVASLALVETLAIKTHLAVVAVQAVLGQTD
jgi:hypothetical protein